MPTTRWTLVRAAGAGAPETDRQRALEVLSRDYWSAIYAYARAWGHGPADAEDATQSFLINFIARDSFAGAAPEGGRFRSWLLASLKHFLLAAQRDRNRLKRGGGRVHVSIDRDLGEAWLDESRTDGETPETIFERRWAAGLLERALGRLEASMRREGKEEVFEVLLPLVAGMDDRVGYADAATRLGLSEGAARVAAFRLRRRLRAYVREEVAATVSGPEEIDDELAHIFSAFQRRGPGL
jgi:RNA polymerase sigma-70 factor (ECF subfamily)